MHSPIELAPNWKHALTLTSPLILASGSIVSSEDTETGIGGRVTIPLSLYARAGAPFPRVVSIPGGFLMQTGAANPGLGRVLHDLGRARTGVGSKSPVIIAFASQSVADWPLMAARLDNAEGVGGIELQLNPTFDASSAVRQTRNACELPILAKLDLDDPSLYQVAADCVEAGANALVVGRSPRGMALVNGRPWYGRLHSPTIKPIVLRVVREIFSRGLGAPIIASGGIHSAADVLECLSVGACAVEIDSAQWINPNTVTEIATELGILR